MASSIETPSLKMESEIVPNITGVREEKSWSLDAQLVFGLMSIDKFVTSNPRLETARNLMVRKTVFQAAPHLETTPFLYLL